MFVSSKLNKEIMSVLQSVRKSFDKSNVNTGYSQRHKVCLACLLKSFKRTILEAKILKSRRHAFGDLAYKALKLPPCDSCDQ
jgi:hypothetical protein